VRDLGRTRSKKQEWKGARVRACESRRGCLWRSRYPSFRRSPPTKSHKGRGPSFCNPSIATLSLPLSSSAHCSEAKKVALHLTRRPRNPPATFLTSEKSIMATCIGVAVSGLARPG